MGLKYLNISQLFRNWQQAGSATCLNYLNKLLQEGVQGVQLVFGRNLHLRAKGRTPEATQHGFLIVSISMIWIDMPPTWIKTLQPPEILYGDGQKGALAGSSSSDIQGPDWLWLWIQNLEHALEYHKHHEHQWKQLSCCGAVAGFHKVLKRSKHELTHTHTHIKKMQVFKTKVTVQWTMLGAAKQPRQKEGRLSTPRTFWCPSHPCAIAVVVRLQSHNMAQSRSRVGDALAAQASNAVWTILCHTYIHARRHNHRYSIYYMYIKYTDYIILKTDKFLGEVTVPFNLNRRNTLASHCPSMPLRFAW